MAKHKQVGTITHYYTDLSVAVIAVASTFSKGDTLLIGKGDPFLKHKATSMQLEHQKIEKTRKGQEIGLKVPEKVRVGDKVLKILP